MSTRVLLFSYESYGALNLDFIQPHAMYRGRSGCNIIGKRYIVIFHPRWICPRRLIEEVQGVKSFGMLSMNNSSHVFPPMWCRAYHSCWSSLFRSRLRYSTYQVLRWIKCDKAFMNSWCDSSSILDWTENKQPRHFRKKNLWLSRWI